MLTSQGHSLFKVLKNCQSVLQELNGSILCKAKGQNGSGN